MTRTSPEDAHPATGPESRLIDRLANAPRSKVVLTLAALIVLVIVLGFVSLRTGRIGELWGIDSDLRVRWPLWDSRVNFPALISSGILGLAGWAWWHAVEGMAARPLRYSARGVGLFLGFMALDETLMIHERLNEALDITWLLLYSPLFLLAGILAVVLLVQLRTRQELIPAALLMVGGLCWVVAQVLEKLQFGPGHVPVDGYWTYVFVEETLENLGSSALLLGGLSAVTRLRAGERGGRTDRSRRPTEAIPHEGVEQPLRPGA